MSVLNQLPLITISGGGGGGNYYDEPVDVTRRGPMCSVCVPPDEPTRESDIYYTERALARMSAALDKNDPRTVGRLFNTVMNMDYDVQNTLNECIDNTPQPAEGRSVVAVYRGAPYIFSIDNEGRVWQTDLCGQDSFLVYRYLLPNGEGLYGAANKLITDGRVVFFTVEYFPSNWTPSSTNTALLRVAPAMHREFLGRTYNSCHECVILPRTCGDDTNVNDLEVADIMVAGGELMGSFLNTKTNELQEYALNLAPPFVSTAF